jgi:hypothetical protein
MAFESISLHRRSNAKLIEKFNSHTALYTPQRDSLPIREKFGTSSLKL